MVCTERDTERALACVRCVGTAVRGRSQSMQLSKSHRVWLETLLRLRAAEELRDECSQQIAGFMAGRGLLGEGELELLLDAALRRSQGICFLGQVLQSLFSRPGYFMSLAQEGGSLLQAALLKQLTRRDPQALGLAGAVAEEERRNPGVLEKKGRRRPEEAPGMAKLVDSLGECEALRQQLMEKLRSKKRKHREDPIPEDGAAAAAEADDAAAMAVLEVEDDAERRQAYLKLSDDQRLAALKRGASKVLAWDRAALARLALTQEPPWSVKTKDLSLDMVPLLEQISWLNPAVRGALAVQLSWKMGAPNAVLRLAAALAQFEPIAALDAVEGLKASALRPLPPEEHLLALLHNNPLPMLEKLVIKAMEARVVGVLLHRSENEIATTAVGPMILPRSLGAALFWFHLGRRKRPAACGPDASDLESSASNKDRSYRKAFMNLLLGASNPGQFLEKICDLELQEEELLQAAEPVAALLETEELEPLEMQLKRFVKLGGRGAARVLRALKPRAAEAPWAVAAARRALSEGEGLPLWLLEHALLWWPLLLAKKPKLEPFLQKVQASYSASLSRADLLSRDLLLAAAGMEEGWGSPWSFRHWAASLKPWTKSFEWDLDQRRVKATTDHFRFDRCASSAETSASEREKDKGEDAYDIAYLLPFLVGQLRLTYQESDGWGSQALGATLGAVCLGGAVEILLLATACSDPTLRACAFEALSIVLAVANLWNVTIVETEEATRLPFRELPELVRLLCYVRDAVELPEDGVPETSRLAASFFAACVPVVAQPQHFLYPALAKHFLGRPAANFQEIPLFHQLMFSGTADVGQEARVWLLRVVRRGLGGGRDAGDKLTRRALMRRNVLPWAMSFAGSREMGSFPVSMEALSCVREALHASALAAEGAALRLGVAEWIANQAARGPSRHSPQALLALGRVVGALLQMASRAESRLADGLQLLAIGRALKALAAAFRDASEPAASEEEEASKQASRQHAVTMLWEHARCLARLLTSLKAEPEPDQTEGAPLARLALASELDATLRLLSSCGGKDSQERQSEALARAAQHGDALRDVMVLLQACPLSTLLYDTACVLLQLAADSGEAWSLDIQQEAVAALWQILRTKTKVAAGSGEAKDSLRKLLCALLALPHSASVAWRLRLLSAAILSLGHSPDATMQRLLSQLPGPSAALAESGGPDEGRRLEPALTTLLARLLFPEKEEEKASYRPFFEHLAASCVPAARRLAAALQKHRHGGLGFVEAPGLARRRMKAPGTQLGSVPELCFFSLVLRHSRQLEFLRLAQGVLLAVQREPLGGENNELAMQLLKMLTGALCARFLEETQEAIEAIAVEKYLEEAVTAHVPSPMRGVPDFAPRVSVLDERCRAFGESGSFLTPLSSLEGHGLVEHLRRQLEALGLLQPDAGIVLSLSGGVDSMVTCCLLRLLQKTVPLRWCAMHLCHPNREDAKDEEAWVQWSCHKLQVDLLSYRPQIRRPHGDLRTGISRERYEEKSKEIRFRMYQLCLQRLGVSKGAALVAHHEDDADENRLAELGKGNIVHINGMAASGETLNVTVVRPLLKVRKQELLDFADQAQVCYMQDSTPKWSRRGWIRHVLDELKLHDASDFGRFLSLLSKAGEASELLGEAIDASLGAWKLNDIYTGVVAVPAASFEEKKGSNEAEPDAVHFPATDVQVVVMRMPALFQLSKDFQAKVTDLMEDFRQIAQLWNVAIQQQAKGRLALEDEVDGDDQPGTCPLQPIRVCDGNFEMGPFVLGRGICVALNAIPEVDHLLKGQLAARKALKHVWDCVARARREHHWGTMHKLCPFLYVREASSLVLCDAEELAKEFADVRWQRQFVQAATCFLEGQKRCRARATFP
ncbi:unnamed protein product, partial [Effrenium voratum]